MTVMVSASNRLPPAPFLARSDREKASLAAGMPHPADHRQNLGSGGYRRRRRLRMVGMHRATMRNRWSLPA
ncbi:hypothetical protein ASE90_17795 [Sphingomonas sp. Leaf67]|nr:hypothetical protein ASE91_02180 [Sphingomonas sp. Leaf62]KQN89896.1 hypothetical protein ASE90_17795 [Sphingomonas sp. Leaf67]